MNSLFAVARAAAICAAIASCRSATSPADDSPARGTDASVTDGLLGPDAAAFDASAVDARAIDAGDMAAIHVLFIGNSYTFVNDLPGMLRALAASSHAAPSITTEQVTPGGTTLQDNYLGPNARPAIAKKAFTHVVLQGQSVEPLLQPAVFEKYALLFAGEARDAGAVPTFYETWARRSGDAFYQDPLSGGSPGAMQDTLATEYAKVAAAGPSGTLLAKVGDGWRSAPARRLAPHSRRHAARRVCALHQADRARRAGSERGACGRNPGRRRCAPRDRAVGHALIAGTRPATIASPRRPTWRQPAPT